MSNAPAIFAIAVGGTSLILVCLALLMVRSGRRRNGRKPSPDGGGSDGLNYASGDSGSHFWNWFGSSDSLFLGGASYFGGSDSAGGDSTAGGDGGGGDGGGGGD